MIYHVPDLEKAKAWYAKVTGINPYFDEPFYVGFDINGFELGLDPNMNQVVKGNHSVGYWAVDNIEDSVNKLIAEGATISSAITDVGGSIKVAVVNDPFGNAVGLIEEALSPA